jgi:hypothetical protein
MPSYKNDINFRIDFEADTKKAQKELQALRE